MDKIAEFLIIVSIASIVLLITALPVLWLWNNALVGAVAGISSIEYWQALGILILSRFLFSTKLTGIDKL